VKKLALVVAAACAVASLAGTSRAAAETRAVKPFVVSITVQKGRPVGGIKRLTAAVVVNHRRQTDDKGKTTAAALTPQEMEQITALVREAMGFSKERGDSLNIVNAAFSEAEKIVVPETPAWKNPEYVSIAKDTGRYLVLAGVVAYLFFGVLRPLLRTALAPRPAAALPGSEAALALSAASASRGDPLQYARELSREDPKVVANVVKSWVNKDG